MTAVFPIKPAKQSPIEPVDVSEEPIALQNSRSRSIDHIEILDSNRTGLVHCLESRREKGQWRITTDNIEPRTNPEALPLTKIARASLR